MLAAQQWSGWPAGQATQRACANCNNLHLLLLVSLLLLLQVQDVQQYYAYIYSFTKAHAHIHALEGLGFQPGAVVTGVMRTRLMHNMTAGTGKSTPRTLLSCAGVSSVVGCLQEPVSYAVAEH
jgi:hypothetical protein